MFIRLLSSQKAIVGLILTSSLLLMAGCEGGGAGTSTSGSTTGGSGIAPVPGGGDGTGGPNLPNIDSGDGGGFEGDTPDDNPAPPPGGGGGGGATGGTDAFVAADGNDGLTAVPFTGVPDSDGFANIFIDVTNATSFQVVTVAEGIQLATVTLTNPADIVVLSFEETQLRTTGTRIGDDVNTIPYRLRGADTPVVDGRYQQEVFFMPGGPAGAFNGSLIVKKDTDITKGNLVVNVHLVGDSAQTGSSRTAVNNAIAIWRTIYAKIGITLDIQIFDVESGNGVLPNPLEGSTFYLTQATAPNVRPFALNVFVGDTISEDDTMVSGNDLTDVLGVASAIPGPAIATTHSAVAISLSEAAGGDGDFSDDDTVTLGETIAHEGGHYLGLFHPVEFDPVTGVFNDDDPLADTPVCTTVQSCVDNGLVNNNMFPAAIGNVVQQNFTPDQGEVVNIQVIVD